ncbi:MAG: polyketide cyclase [Bacteroidetes bacterium]|nr:MAG: polyketide cyclase [Bacteroidota bacterium]
MMTFLYILGIIIGVLVLLASFAPKKYDVNRSIVINRPRPEVFQYLKYIKNQDEWSPWKNRDPEMKQTFSGEDGTVGFISKWDSDHKQVGAGEQEIIGITPDEQIRTELRFLKPWKSVSTAYIETRESADGATKVTWGFSGTNKVPMNIMMLFYNMDKAVGKDFEEGLEELKIVLENQLKEPNFEK